MLIKHNYFSIIDVIGHGFSDEVTIHNSKISWISDINCLNKTLAGERTHKFSRTHAYITEIRSRSLM